MVFALLFVIGIIIGSFLNVLIDRLATGRSFIKGRSYCEHCKHSLAPLDLIPVVSYILLSGKCRYCKKPIPARLIVVELLTGLSFLGAYLYSASASISPLQMIFLALALASLIVIFFADLEYGVIPDSILLFLAISTIVFHALWDPASLVSYGLTGCAAFAAFLFLFFITKEKGMGFGDVKFAFVIGLLLGVSKTVLALYLAFLTGAIVSIILILWGKKHYKKSTIPFGPFLVFSTILSLFYGNNLVSLLVKTFF